MVEEVAPIPEELSPGLKMTFRDVSFIVPPPSARVGKHANAIIGEMARAEERGEQIDTDRVKRKLGLTEDDDYYDYDIEQLLFGPELYESLLDNLTVEEMSLAGQAMFIWVTADKDSAEQFLADPTGARANRATRRARSRKATRK